MRKGLAAAGVVALISAGSAACGADDPASPQGKVDNAFQKLGKQNTITVDLGFSGTSASIYSAMKGEDGFTQADADLLASLHVTIGGSSQKSLSLLGKSLGKDAGATKDSSAGFLLSTDGPSGKKLIEVRAVGQKVYLRADVQGLEKLDTDRSDAGSIAEFNDQYLDSLSSTPGSVGAAASGKWVSIDPAVWSAFVKTALAAQGGGSDSGSTTPTLDAKTQNQVVAGLQAALTKDATFADAGKKDGADHITVTVPARQFAQDVASGVAPALKQIPGMKQSDLDEMQRAEGVPAKKVTADVAVKDGSVSSITFDIHQLDSESTGPLPLTVSFKGSAAPITAPSGAVALNPQDVVSAVMGMMGDDSGSSDDSMF
ncbi:hypothetical protein RVR_6000 [Actinacidiphila reveromycinica]|uniref:Lipoprotein n=1 Tax=Actinacidiphila reveromycinica TaxID=659352 RepID=A0A7U3UV80_9ACTN|nr:hypothetical protein [Streptomyces sp. SN-593]BBA99398.1 hypothetical protein RVR_6000 [Streptomyces sp. SN-593]